jgi:hypothetical protein
METRFIYDLILPFFIGEDNLRPALSKVHKVDGHLYATEGHILVRIPQEKVANHSRYGEVPNYPNAAKVIQDAIDREGNTAATIHTNDLIRVLSGVSWRRVTTYDKCPECKGKGVCECVHCGNETECKECKGEGKVNVRIKEYSLLESDDRYSIKIGLPVYRADKLQIIAIAARMLQEEYITYYYREKNEAGIFSFAGIDILLVSVQDKENEIIRIIKL